MDKNAASAVSKAVKKVANAVVKAAKSVASSISNTFKLSKSTPNRRPNNGDPGSTYTAPNGDTRTYGRMGIQSMIGIMMIMVDQINIHMMVMEDIIMIGKMGKEVRHMQILFNQS